MEREITVAVVGAGAAGLNALRVLNHNPEGAQTKFKATAFEQSSRIGGTWFYNECVGTDELGIPVHSSMYKNLRSNLPKETMAFPDYPFPSHLPSFVHHEDVYRYLEDYTTNFDLWKDIKFKTVVEHIKPVSDEDNKFGVKWEVTTADVTNRKDKQTEAFDAVLVCNGHFSKPMMPKVPGLDTFKGHLLHSHDYRQPDVYTGKTVLLLGGSQSGKDISCEVSGVATKVYLSHNKPKITAILAPKVEQKPGIKCCHERVVEFKDGSSAEVDAIILCTGYLYDFAFLDVSIGIRVEDERVTPLFKHFLSADYPSLGVIGIAKSGLAFPISHIQILYFRSILDGSGTLPSKKEMLRDEEEEFDELIGRGDPPRYAHHLAGRQFQYMKELADLGHFDRLPSVIEEITKTAEWYRNTDFTTYRDFNFILSADNNIDFKVVPL